MSRVAHTYPVRCAAGECQSMIREGLLMCRTHWSRVPLHTQELVYRRLREWRETPSMETVRAYREAKGRAIREVARYQESHL